MGLNEGAEPLVRVLADFGEAHREPDPSHRTDYCSLNSDRPRGQVNNDFWNVRALRRGGSTLDVTAGWAEAADTGSLLTPHTDPRAIEILLGSPSLSPVRALIACLRTSAPQSFEPTHRLPLRGAIKAGKNNAKLSASLSTDVPVGPKRILNFESLGH